jgi:AcrR family transcriptional regulator
LLKHGYHGIDDIARRARVAKGTFFVHFKTKDAVVRRLMEHQTTAARRAREGAPGPLESLKATVMELGKQAGASRMLSRAVLAATLESDLLGEQATDLFGGLFEDMCADARAAAKAGLLEKGIEPERLARTLLTMYLGSAFYFSSSARADALPVYLEALVDGELASARRKTSRPSRSRITKRLP